MDKQRYSTLASVFKIFPIHAGHAVKGMSGHICWFWSVALWLVGNGGFMPLLIGSACTPANCGSVCSQPGTPCPVKRPSGGRYARWMWLNWKSVWLNVGSTWPSSIRRHRLW